VQVALNDGGVGPAAARVLLDRLAAVFLAEPGLEAQSGLIARELTAPTPIGAERVGALVQSWVLDVARRLTNGVEPTTEQLIQAAACLGQVLTFRFLKTQTPALLGWRRFGLTELRALQSALWGRLTEESRV
jgi:hypothetical protein